MTSKIAGSSRGPCAYCISATDGSKGMCISSQNSFAYQLRKRCPAIVNKFNGTCRTQKDSSLFDMLRKIVMKYSCLAIYKSPDAPTRRCLSSADLEAILQAFGYSVGKQVRVCSTETDVVSSNSAALAGIDPLDSRAHLLSDCRQATSYKSDQIPKINFCQKMNGLQLDGRVVTTLSVQRFGFLDRQQYINHMVTEENMSSEAAARKFEIDSSRHPPAENGVAVARVTYPREEHVIYGSSQFDAISILTNLKRKRGPPANVVTTVTNVECTNSTEHDTGEPDSVCKDACMLPCKDAQGGNEKEISDGNAVQHKEPELPLKKRLKCSSTKQGPEQGNKSGDSEIPTSVREALQQEKRTNSYFVGYESRKVQAKLQSEGFSSNFSRIMGKRISAAHSIYVSALGSSCALSVFFPNPRIWLRWTLLVLTTCHGLKYLRVLGKRPLEVNTFGTYLIVTT